MLIPILLLAILLIALAIAYQVGWAAGERSGYGQAWIDMAVFAAEQDRQEAAEAAAERGVTVSADHHRRQVESARRGMQ